MPLVLALCLLASGFAAALLLFSRLAAPKGRDGALKKEAYECGAEVQTAPSSRMPVQFYRTGLLFILFDIEILFLYPFAMIYRDSLNAGAGAPLLAAVGIFLALFVFGLWWEIRSKALSWK